MDKHKLISVCPLINKSTNFTLGNISRKAKCWKNMLDTQSSDEIQKQT